MLSDIVSRLNDRRDAAADLGEDEGFTLIELMVVLLILAILLAIAIPTFLGVTGGANDRAAQSNLNTALTTAKALETQNNQTYAGITTTSLHSNEPSITFDSASVLNTGDVSVYVDQTTTAGLTTTGGGQGIVLASWSPANSGTCWYVSDNIGTVTDTAGPYTAAVAGPPAFSAAPTSAGTSYAQSDNVTQANCTAAGPIPGTVTWAASFGTAAKSS